MNNGNTIISWTGPYKFKDFFEETNFERFKKPGLYLWKEWDLKREKAIITYFGKASSKTTLLGRLQNHYCLQLGLTYLIPDKRLTRDNPYYVPVFDPQYKDTFYNLNDRQKIIRNNMKNVQDKEEVIKIVNKGFEYANSIDIYIGTVKDSEGKNYEGPDLSKKLKELEAIFLYHIKPLRTKMGTVNPPKVTHKITNEPSEIIDLINEKIDTSLNPQMLKVAY